MAAGCRSCGVKVAVLVALVLQCLLMRSDVVDAQGTWQLLLANAGIASMHTAVTHNGPVIFLDRTDIGASQIALPNGQCRDDPNDQKLKHDCTAHSVMFNPASNTVRALFVHTDTWCSSGQFFPDGTLWQTGGDSDGNTKIRTLTPCGGGGTCDWVETTTPLASGRWYSSNQLLPDGKRQIVVGGRSAPTYEFVPKRSAGEGTFPLALLTKGGDNLYPYVHLMPDGNLFIFASRDSVLLNWNTGAIVRSYPTIPGNTRNYPAAGSSVLLPLTWQTGFSKAEILICGGSTAGGQAGPPASTSCGRMEASAANAAWAMENMPVRRNMGDMVTKPDGDILIINGAQNGAQGWGSASNPALQPCNYATNNPAARFTLYTATTIPRVYHSTANLLPDGRILLAGSNTHQFYTFSGTFPTELRVEAFSPPYLGANFNNLKPKITGAPASIRYAKVFTVTFTVGTRQGTVEANMNSAPFVTHSYAQGQRQLKLFTSVPVAAGGGWTMQVTSPPTGNVAPPQYYMLFIVQAGIPSTAKWVKLA